MIWFTLRNLVKEVKLGILIAFNMPVLILQRYNAVDVDVFQPLFTLIFFFF